MMETTTATSSSTTVQFSEATRREQERHRDTLEALEQSQRARQLIVPTDDVLVKMRLRELGEPICLFAEQPYERRDRLRELLIQIGSTQAMPEGAVEEQVAEPTPEKQEAFYIVGKPELQAARMFIAQYSLPRTRDRLKRAQDKRNALIRTTEMLLEKDERSLSEDTVAQLLQELKSDKKQETELVAHIEVCAVYACLTCQPTDEATNQY
jgi:hypothetical protein